MAVAEHEPDKLYSRNQKVTKMGKSSLHDFAATSEKGLPKRKSSKSSMGKSCPKR